MGASLPETISEDEKLARIICASSKPAKYKKTHFYFNEQSNKYVILPGVFIDDRNPAELSVNRISSITLQEAHQLGLDHQKEKQPQSTYHGFGEVTAKLCYDNKCALKKEDYNGTKPYHANIVYPYAQNGKEDKQEIAAVLAFHAEMYKYST